MLFYWLESGTANERFFFSFVTVAQAWEYLDVFLLCECRLKTEQVIGIAFFYFIFPKYLYHEYLNQVFAIHQLHFCVAYDHEPVMKDAATT